jgi:hypothetical protein
MRVSDADRDAALAELSEHYQAGRLTTEEMEERSAKALAAKTGSDLTGLLADLPPTGVAAPKAPPERRSRGGWAAASTAALALVAVLALILGIVIGHEHHGAWVPWWIIPVAFIVLRRMTSGPSPLTTITTEFRSTGSTVSRTGGPRRAALTPAALASSRPSSGHDSRATARGWPAS